MLSLSFPRMVPVPSELVQETWQELSDAGAEQTRLWVGGFRREQPVLSGFLLAAEESLFQDDDRGALLLYGLWAWRAFRKTVGAGREITEEIIEGAFSENERLLAALEATAPGRVMDTAADWTETYAQMPLLGAMLHEAMSGELEETRRVDDLLGLLTLYLKTMVDCLALD